MDNKKIKKLLAGLGVAGLIGTGGLTLPNSHAASGWSAAPSAGSAEKAVEQTSSGAKDTATSAVEEAKEKAAEGVEAEAKKKVDEAAGAVKEEVENAAEKAPDSSGSK